MKYKFLLFVLLVSLHASAKLPDLIPYRSGNLWGYCDSTKKIIIPCRFTSVSLFGDAETAQGSLDNVPGTITKSGYFQASVPQLYNNYTWFPYGSYFVTLSPYKYTGPVPFSDSITGLYGYKNEKGKIIIPCRFVSAGTFSEGLAPVKLTYESMQYINEKGKVVLDYPECEATGNNFKNGVAIIKEGAGYGLIDKKGNYVILPLCNELTDAGNFYIASEYEDYQNSMLLNRKGKMIDKRIFSSMTSISDNYWIAVYREKYGYLDANGKELTPFMYEEAHDFSEGLAAVQDTNIRWGYINASGQKVIPFIYAEAGDFTNGLSLVLDSNNRYGFINAKGIEHIPCKYIGAYTFSQGLAAVSNANNDWGFIDVNGNVKMPFKYRQPAANGFTENGLCEIYNTGFIDIYGTEYWAD